MSEQPLTRDLAEIMESLGRTLEAKKEAAILETPQNAPKSPGASKVAQLILFPHWADTRKAAPNAIFRGACFPALHRRKRQFFENHKLGSVEGVEIFFTGQQFDQSDLSVYLVLLDLLRQQETPFGTEREIPAYTILKALGLPTGGRNHKWLHSVLIRLCGGIFDITDRKKRYFGGLLSGGFKDELSNHYRLSINPNFAVLFGFGMWASINWQQRQAMKKSPTAQALHAYLSTHAAPGFHNIDTYAEIVGLEGKTKRKVRARILAAFKLMTSEAVGFLSGYELSGDGKSVKPHVKHTKTQAQHIGRKIAASKRQKKSREQARYSASTNTV
jgi:TrfA protein